LKALAVEPQDRYADARGLRDELDRWLDRQSTPSRLSQPLACVVMGIGAALLLIVGVQAVLSPVLVKPLPLVAQREAARPVPAPMTAMADSGQSELVGSTNMRTYHLPRCRNADQIKPDHRRVFTSADDAIAAGYHPCKTCQPPSGRAVSSAAAPAASD
jgi:hypothetical protein